MKHQKLEHVHLASDERYTITREFCGYEEPRFVLRFCGDYLANSKFYSSMLLLAMGESVKRRGCPVIEAIDGKGEES